MFSFIRNGFKCKWIKVSLKTEIGRMDKNTWSNQMLSTRDSQTDWKWKDGKTFCANSNQKRAGVAILIDKIDFNSKKVTRNKGYYTLIKGLTQQEDIIIINIYVPKNRPTKHMNQKPTELKWEIDSSTIIVGDLNTPLSVTDRLKISEEAGRNTISQLDLTDV